MEQGRRRTGSWVLNGKPLSLVDCFYVTHPGLGELPQLQAPAPAGLPSLRANGAQKALAALGVLWAEGWKMKCPPVPGGLSSVCSDPPAPVSPRIGASGAGLGFTHSPPSTIFDSQGFFFHSPPPCIFLLKGTLAQVSSIIRVCPRPLQCSPKWELAVNPPCSPSLQMGCPDLPLPGAGYRSGNVGVFINSCAASPLAHTAPQALGDTWPLPGPCHGALVCVSIHPAGNAELH